MSAPALLTLAAQEVASGEDLDAETISQLLLLRRHLREAEKVVDQRIQDLAEGMRRAPYQRRGLEVVAG